MPEKVMVRIRYALLSGKRTSKTKFLSTTNIIDDFPKQLKIGQFISQTKEDPQGFFIITAVDRKQKTIALKEVNCAPIHWKGDGNGVGKGPDEGCKKIQCRFLPQCPISAHIMMMADID